MARGLRLGGKRSAIAEERPLNDDEVARVAYQLFEQRGRVHGGDQRDWFMAEQLVRERQNRATRN